MHRPLEKGTGKFKEPKGKMRMAVVVVGSGQNDKERDAGDTVK